MKRFLATTVLACVVLVLPCFLLASSSSEGNQGPSLMEWVSSPPPADSDTDGRPGSAKKTEGDPDELGGGFRNSGDQSSNDKGLNAAPGKVIDSLVLLLLRLL